MILKFFGAIKTYIVLCKIVCILGIEARQNP